MPKFVIEPHFRLQEWVAEEKGYFRAEGLDYEFREFIRASGGAHHVKGDKDLYVAAVKNNLQVYSRDGIVSPQSRQRSLDFLKKFDKEMAAATVDPATTWDGRFVAKAAETIK